MDMNEIRRRERETANVVECLLAQGKAIVYQIDGDPKKPIVREYPGGRI